MKLPPFFFEASLFIGICNSNEMTVSLVSFLLKPISSQEGLCPFWQTKWDNLVSAFCELSHFDSFLSCSYNTWQFLSLKSIVVYHPIF